MSHKTPLKYSSVSRSPQKRHKPVSYFSQKKKQTRGSRFAGWWRYLLGLVLAGILVLLAGYAYLSSTLPDLDHMADVVFPEATEVQDRNGEVLYKIFQENRSYVQYEDIAPSIVNAMVSIEDQSFWTNSGIDYRGIIRAARNTIFKGSTEGASTITQQLLKNIILNKESSKYTRKFKERLLAGRLNALIKRQIQQEHPSIKGDKLQRKMKEEIMELYLNYIFLGQNSYGVEAASQTFFAKSAKDVSVLEAAILASLPKSPTKYNPYVNPHYVMGQLRFFQGTEEVTPSDNVLVKTREHIAGLLPRLQMNNKDASSLEKQLGSLMSFSLTVDGRTYRVTYDLGRKDYILMNMYDEGYIESPTFKSAFLDGFSYTFTNGKKTDIKAPHFVRWVQDEVLKLFPENGEQLLQRGGLQITTTLDYQMQQWAEQSIEENYRKTQGFGANNAGMIYVDSTNGDVLTYVGSADYFNKEIDGEVDMVRAMRQPGSSIKPLIYALGIEKLGLTLDTPIFDLALKVGRNTPQNADGQFMGLMPVRKALAFSRNIAPVKIFLALGGEDVVKPWLWNLGLKSLSSNVGYGYPLAIGAGEVQMLELANAYAHLSTSGHPAQINPILRITGSDGTILYEKTTKKQKQIIPDGVANMIAKMLSDKGNMPPGWVSNYTLPGRLTYATKSGTSDVKVMKNGREKILPRDGWLVSYTPSKVAIFWSGNTDAKPMGAKAFGGWLNAPIWKSFFGQLIKNNLIARESFPTSDMVSIDVDKYSGLLPHGALPEDATVSTLAYAGNVPRQGAPTWESLEYDKSCGGKVSPLTPSSDLATGRLVKPTTFMSDKRDLSAITQWFEEEEGLFLQRPEEVCEGRSGQQDDQIVIDVMKPLAGSTVTKKFDVWYNVKNTRYLSTVRVFINDVKVSEKPMRSQKEVTALAPIVSYQGLEPGEHLLTVEVADIEGFVNRKQIPITIATTDAVAPYLLKERVRVDQGSGSYTVYFVFADDASSVASIDLSAGGSPLDFTKLKESVVMFDVETLGSVDYVVKDSFGNTLSDSIDLTSYAN